MNKILTNAEIFGLASELPKVFKETDIFPVKINFYLQKNIKKLTELAQEIDAERINIIKKYGTLVENNQYSVSSENIDKANSELQDLLNLTQEVPVSIVSLDLFDGINLSIEQVSAISFMIEE